LPFFDKLETDYNKRITNHETKMDSIAVLKTIIKDYENAIENSKEYSKIRK